MISPCTQYELGYKALSDLPYKHGYHSRELVEDKHAPRHFRLVVHPRGGYVGDPAIPIHHIHAEIGRGFPRPEHPECGRVAHRFTASNHGEVGSLEPGRDVGDTRDGGRAGISGDSVGGYVHWPQTGDGGPVGGAVPYL